MESLPMRLIIQCLALTILLAAAQERRVPLISVQLLLMSQVCILMIDKFHLQAIPPLRYQTLPILPAIPWTHHPYRDHHLLPKTMKRSRSKANQGPYLSKACVQEAIQQQLTSRLLTRPVIPEYLTLSTILFEWADSYDSKNYQR